MSGIALGLGQAGRGEPGMLTVSVFLGMWVGMMVAMMFPTAVPMVLAHRAVVSRRGEGPLPTLAFVAGYLVVWTVAGVLPLGVLLSVQYATADAAASPWVAALSGSVLIVAGAYQFSDWKARCRSRLILGVNALRA